jgi:hypothetical protein
MPAWQRFVILSFLLLLLTAAVDVGPKNKKKSKKKKSNKKSGKKASPEERAEAFEMLGPTADMDTCEEFAQSFWEHRTGLNASQEERVFVDMLLYEAGGSGSDSDKKKSNPLFDALQELAPPQADPDDGTSPTTMTTATTTTTHRMVWVSLLQLGHDFVLELRRGPNGRELQARPFSAWVIDAGDADDPPFAFSPDKRRVAQQESFNTDWAARTGYTAAEWVASGRSAWWNEARLEAACATLRDVHKQARRLATDHLMECAANHIVGVSYVGSGGGNGGESVGDGDGAESMVDRIRELAAGDDEKKRRAISDWAEAIVASVDEQPLVQQPANMADEGYREFMAQEGHPPHAVVYRMEPSLGGEAEAVEARGGGGGTGTGTTQQQQQQQQQQVPVQLLDFHVDDAMPIVDAVAELFGEHPIGFPWFKMLTHDDRGSVALLAGDARRDHGDIHDHGYMEDEVGGEL